MHECCLAWKHVITAGYTCPACLAAEFVIRRIAGNQQRKRAGKKLLPVLPDWLPPLPPALPDGTPFVPGPLPVPRCEACGLAMTVIIPGQHRHPLCAGDRAAARPLRRAA